MSSKKNHGAGIATGVTTAPGTAGTRTDPARPKAAGEPLLIRHGGHCYAALAWGPANGRRVLALHGWLDNAASFSLLGPLLNNCRVIAVDLPGHGLSPHRRDGHYHFVDYVFDAIHAADGLGWQNFDLLGHSLGAGIATLVAGTFPERIGKLVLLEGIGPLTREAADMPAALRQAWLKAQALAGKSPPSYAEFEDAVRARAGGGGGVTTEAARLLCERGLYKQDGRWYWRNDARLTLPSVQRLTRSQVLAFIRKIEADTLVVRARQGMPFDERVMQKRISALAQARLVHLDGGHHLHLENAARGVAAEVITHLI